MRRGSCGQHGGSAESAGLVGGTDGACDTTLKGFRDKEAEALGGAAKAHTMRHAECLGVEPLEGAVAATLAAIDAQAWLKGEQHVARVAWPPSIRMWIQDQTYASVRIDISQKIL